jgi:hypothetical protein
VGIDSLERGKLFIGITHFIAGHSVHTDLTQEFDLDTLNNTNNNQTYQPSITSANGAISVHQVQRRQQKYAIGNAGKWGEISMQKQQDCRDPNARHISRRNT